MIFGKKNSQLFESRNSISQHGIFIQQENLFVNTCLKMEHNFRIYFLNAFILAHKIG